MLVPQPPLRLRYCVEGFVVFSLMELLKNACVAMVGAYGVLDVDEDDTPPIVVRAAPSAHRNGVDITVRDRGAGLAAGFDPFGYSATGAAGGKGVHMTVEGREPAYGYSRDHGAAMSGHGVGLPRARVFAAFHGGSVALSAAGGGGAVATLHLPLLDRARSA